MALFWKLTKKSGMSSLKPRPDCSQRGSVFTVLLAGIAMASALSIVLYQTISGPMSSMVRVTNKTVARAQLQSVSNIVIMDALNQASAGDCDGDGSVEPREWRDPPVPTAAPGGAGLIPLSIGAPVSDPWGTDYGYCVWDVGTNIKAAGCGGGAAKRLSGTPTPQAGNAVTQTVIAIVSAGPNRQFQTSCRDYVDATTDTIFPTGTPLGSGAGGDDVVQRFTYVEAASATSSIWTLKVGDASKAVIAKDLEVGPAQTVKITTSGIGDSSGLINAVAVQTSSQVTAGGGVRFGDETVVTACNNPGLVRYNSVIKDLQVCDGVAGTWNVPGSNGGLAISSLTAATKNNNLASAAWEQTWAWSGLATNAAGLSLAASLPGAATGTRTLSVSNTDATGYALYNTGRAYFSDNVGIGTTNPNITGLNTPTLTLEGQSAGRGPSIEQSWKSNTLPTEVGILRWLAGATPAQIAAIQVTTNGTNIDSGDLRFWTKATGTGIANSMTIDSTGNVGIGTTTPTDKLHIVDQTNAGWRYVQYHDGDGANLRNYRARGTIAVPSAVLANDRLADILGGGYHNGGAFSSPMAGMNIIASENFTSTAQGTYLTFVTSQNGTTTAQSERMRIDNAGNVGIGNTSPYSPLHVAVGGWADQTVTPDTSSFPTDNNGKGLTLDGNYQDGRYRFRLPIVDRGANLALYVQQGGSLSNSFTNIARFGAHAQSSNEFEVFGDAKIGGDLTVTGTIAGVFTPIWATGGIPFGTGAGSSVDTANLFWDNTNKRLGIGSMATYAGVPQAPLHIMGPAGWGTSNELLRLENAGTYGGTKFVEYSQDGSNWGLKLQDTNNNVRVTFNHSNGNVGIGTTGPSYKLHVAGDIYSTGQQFINNTSPTIYLQDSNEISSMIHQNSSLFYVLRGCGVNSTGWCTLNGYWPMYLNMNTNEAVFGGQITAPAGAVVASGQVQAGNGGGILNTNGDVYMSYKGQWLSTALGWNGATYNPSFGTAYTDNWFRSWGNSGWYNQSWCGGWWMADPTWIRNYCDKSLLISTGNSVGIQIGPNASWGQYLRVGGWFGEASAATVTTSDGNLHLDSMSSYFGGQAHHIYLNWYSRYWFYKCGFGCRWTQAASNTYAAGDICAYSGAYCLSALSDRRLKRDIKELEKDYGLSAVMNLRPVTFRWKDKNKDALLGEQVGFIAQEVEKIFPVGFVRELPSVETIHTTAGEEFIDSPKNLPLTNLVPPLVKAVQELAVQLKALAADVADVVKKHAEIFADLSGHDKRLTALEAENKELRKELETLKARLAPVKR